MILEGLETSKAHLEAEIAHNLCGENSYVATGNLLEHFLDRADHKRGRRAASSAKRIRISSIAGCALIEHRRHHMVLTQLSVNVERVAANDAHPILFIPIAMRLAASGLATVATGAYNARKQERNDPMVA